MSRSQAFIEDRITTAFPIIFGKSDSVDRDDYLVKQAALIDYGISVSTPSLTAETIRYQVMLLYAALVLLVIKVVNLTDVEWSGMKVHLDDRAGYFLCVFVFLIALFFAMKARVDYRRNEFTREKNVHAVVDLRHLLAIGQARRNLQNFFWLEIFDLIAASYPSYTDAQNQARGQAVSSAAPIKMNALVVDVEALRASPDLSAEISRYEAVRKWVKTEIDSAEQAFRRDAEAALAQAAKGMQAQSGSAWEGVQAAFETHLKPWFDARGRLTDAHLHDVLDKFDASPEGSRAEHLLKMLKRIVAVRSASFMVELVAPLLFAGAVVAYFLFG